MKRVIKLGIQCLLLMLSVAQVRAGTTNYWVQNVNLKLTAYVQEKQRLLHGSLPTKQFLAFLSGVTNPAVVVSQSVVQATNSFYTNLTVEVTNSWLLPTTPTPPEEFPRGYMYTANYVVTPNDGATFYTNNVNFTNDIVVTRGSGTNVVYTFANSVSVPTNRTAYLFPELRADSVTATLTNHGPGTVFALSGWVLTNAVSSVTNDVHGPNPDFTKQSGAKLLFITTIVDSTNASSRYVVRYKDGKQERDVDIGSFMSEYYGNPYVAVSESFVPGTTRTYAFSGVDFNNQAGTSFNLIGFDTQVWSVPKSKTTPVNIQLLKQRKLDVGNYGGYISGQIQDRKFNFATTVVRGTVTISGGKLE